MISYKRSVGLIISHILAIFGFVSIINNSNPWYLFFEILIWHNICGLGITAGAHRLWTHRSYKATNFLKWFLMILNSISNQGHLIYWCRDHRTHHKYSDREEDPHSSLYGFFYSHMGWLLTKKPKKVVDAGKKIPIDDLYRDDVVMFQYNLFPWWNLFWCFLVPTMYGKWRLDSYWEGFLIFGIFRWLWTMHSTWCVNSFAHFYGYRPYNDQIEARESWITSILAVGEGWHNYHHKYPYDYATSEYGIFYQWNPTKLFIDTMYYLGQAYDLKRVKNVKKIDYISQKKKHKDTNLLKNI